jgi:hypothetical protein
MRSFVKIKVLIAFVAAVTGAQRPEMEKKDSGPSLGALIGNMVEASKKSLHSASTSFS